MQIVLCHGLYAMTYNLKRRVTGRLSCRSCYLFRVNSIAPMLYQAITFEAATSWIQGEMRISCISCVRWFQGRRSVDFSWEI